MQANPWSAERQRHRHAEPRTTPFTRSFRVVFAGDLAGTEPETMTVTSHLTGQGAGVVVTPIPRRPSRSPSRRSATSPTGTPQFTADAGRLPRRLQDRHRADRHAAARPPAERRVYLATPHQNPFGSLLAIYIAVDDPETGRRDQAAGPIEADPQTGQLTTTFNENPQLPFEDLKLDFFKGSPAPLKTAIACGTYQSTTE